MLSNFKSAVTTVEMSCFGEATEMVSLLVVFCSYIVRVALVLLALVFVRADALSIKCSSSRIQHTQHGLLNIRAIPPPLKLFLFVVFCFITLALPYHPQATLNGTMTINVLTSQSSLAGALGDILDFSSIWFFSLCSLLLMEEILH